MSAARTEVVIDGIGTALPPGGLTQPQAAEIIRSTAGGGPEDAPTIEALFRRTRIFRRASVIVDPDAGGAPRQEFYPPAAGPDDRGPTTEARMARYAAEAGALAERAAREALRESGLAAGGVDDLVAVSCTGFDAPGFDVDLVDRLGLRRDVRRTLVGFMGCHGLLNGLRAAEGFVRAAPASASLVVAVELCSLHLRYGPAREGGVANALFADGAAALAVRAAGPGTPAARRRVRTTGSWLVPDSRDAMTWRVGDHGFEMTLSPRLPELIAAALPGWLDGWLASSGLRRGEVGSWAVHPGGPRILEAVERSLALPPDALEDSRGVLADHGNMSSATLAFVLRRLAERNARRPCVALAFGPGLAIEAVLLD